ncbi:hypothetical protein [Saccharothrix sp. Mg75]|uniref:hypothetical protein n=1 Tax=Saccharothrix sp. Mg75 TaxID=3445357 RepID=UPI003EE9855F
MVPAGHLLFDRNVHDLYRTRRDTGALKSNALSERIEAFVTWTNAEATTRGLTGEVIPPDPHGRIGTARFRRSLALHIARKPGGLVALAIQYGHLRTAVSAGYASRGQGGIDELLDVETICAVADTVADLHHDLHEGVGVSGPAARRAAATAPRFAGTVITATTARRLLANEDAMLYDNPHALLLCHYKRATALCHRDGVRNTPASTTASPAAATSPAPTTTPPLLRERTDLLDRRATRVPGPLAQRLRGTAATLRGHADTHDRTRITPNSGDTRRHDTDEDTR